MVIMIMKVIVKQRIIRSIDIQISMTHYILPKNSERYIYQSKIILLSVWYVCACVFPHAHLLVKSKEQARQCAIFRGRCFSFVRTITSRKLMHAHRKKRSWKVVVVSLNVLSHTPVPLTDRQRGREMLAPNSTSCTHPCNYTTAQFCNVYEASGIKWHIYLKKQLHSKPCGSYTRVDWVFWYR